MRGIILPVAVMALAFATLDTARASGDAERGEYIARLGGCHGCHTDPKQKNRLFAGGVELKSPFGTFYAPNITPDPETGIGGWSDEDFLRSMTRGRGPGGRYLYPAFPYTSYTKMTRGDLLDLKAYIDSLPPIRNEVPSHELDFPYNVRFLLAGWQLLFFRPGEFQPDPEKSESWNRGAYLVNGPGHCGECHTSRNFFGAILPDLALAGTRRGPDGKPVPNITPAPKGGIGTWSAGDISFALKTATTPDGDVLGGAMGEYIDSNSSRWTDEDLDAVAEYLLSLPARPSP